MEEEVDKLIELEEEYEFLKAFCDDENEIEKSYQNYLNQKEKVENISKINSNED